jgi:hypothetical protein
MDANQASSNRFSFWSLNLNWESFQTQPLTTQTNVLVGQFNNYTVRDLTDSIVNNLENFLEETVENHKQNLEGSQKERFMKKLDDYTPNHLKDQIEEWLQQNDWNAEHLDMVSKSQQTALRDSVIATLQDSVLADLIAANQQFPTLRADSQETILSVVSLSRESLAAEEAHATQTTQLSISASLENILDDQLIYFSPQNLNVSLRADSQEVLSLSPRVPCRLLAEEEYLTPTALSPLDFSSQGLSGDQLTLKADSQEYLPLTAPASHTTLIAKEENLTPIIPSPINLSLKNSLDSQLTLKADSQAAKTPMARLTGDLSIVEKETILSAVSSSVRPSHKNLADSQLTLKADSQEDIPLTAPRVGALLMAEHEDISPTMSVVGRVFLTEREAILPTVVLSTTPNSKDFLDDQQTLKADSQENIPLPAPLILTPNLNLKRSSESLANEVKPVSPIISKTSLKANSKTNRSQIISKPIDQGLQKDLEDPHATQLDLERAHSASFIIEVEKIPLKQKALQPKSARTILPKLTKKQEMEWFTDDQMNALLHHYFGSRGHIRIGVAIDVLQNNGETFLDNLQELQIQQTEETSVTNLVQDTIIIPINLGNRHWTSLYIYFNTENRLAPNIVYCDPLGHELPETVLLSLYTVFPETVNFTCTSKPFQQDGYNCGPWTIAIFESLIETNGTDLPYANLDIQEFRKAYLKDYQQIVADIAQRPTVSSSENMVYDQSEIFEQEMPIISIDVLEHIAYRVKAEVGRRFYCATDEERENFYQALHTPKIKALIYDTYQAIKLNASDSIQNVPINSELENEIVNIAMDKFEAIVEQKFEMLSKTEYILPIVDHWLPKRAKISNLNELNNIQISIQKCVKEFLEDNKGQFLEKLNLTKVPADVTDILKTFLQLEDGKAVIENVKYLNLSECEADIEAYELLSKFPQLSELNVSDCDSFTGEALETLQNLPNLNTLNCSHCLEFRGYYLSKLAPSTASALKWIYLNFENCRRIVDEDLNYLINLKNLETLNLKNCTKITDAGLITLASLENLTELNLLSCSRVTEIGVTLLQIALPRCKIFFDSSAEPSTDSESDSTFEDNLMI